MGYADEFVTVDLIIDSTAETRGVDAFALSLIKAERQLRKLFTHLVYQCPPFLNGDIADLREALTDNKDVYFNGFIRGFDALYRRSLRDLIGAEYDHLRARFDEATKIRDKIFHGQLTPRYLSTEDLLGYVDDIRRWCKTLSEAALVEFAYDGFAHDSFRKSSVPDLCTRLKQQFASVAEYEEFIRRNMQRRKP
jgi:hypothetical protein